MSEVPMSPLLWMDGLPARAPRTAAHDGPCTILYVGQMVREKGIFELVEAIARLRADGRRVRLVMVGGGADLEACQARAEALGVRDAVEFAGSVHDPSALAARFAAADALALPSFAEGFPRVLWEAMAFSLPIVTTPVGQIATVLTGEDSALFCAPGSVDSLVGALTRVLDDAELAVRIGARGNALWLAEKERCRELGTHGDQVVRELVAQGFLVGAGAGAHTGGA